MPSAHLGRAWHGFSVAQPVMHTSVQTCVPLLAAGLGTHSLSGIQVWVNTCRVMGCNGLADPASVSEELPRLQSWGVSFGKVSRFPSSSGAVPLQHCYLNGLTKLCLSKVPSGLMVAPTPLGQVERGVQTY